MYIEHLVKNLKKYFQIDLNVMNNFSSRTLSIRCFLDLLEFFLNCRLELNCSIFYEQRTFN